MKISTKLIITIPVLALSIMATSCQPRNSEAWSMFRGPNGSGVSETAGLPIEFGPETNVIWKTEVPVGYSSPVLTDEYILLTALEGKNLYTICLNRSDGEVVWKTLAPRPRQTPIDNRNNAASPSVVTDGTSLFVFFADFGLLGYDMKGNELWQVPLGPFNNVYGMGASPILAGDNVVLVCDQNTDSFIIAVSKATGKVAWKDDRLEATSGHCTPILYQPEEGDLQVLVPGSFVLTAYSAVTGDKVWWVGGLSFEMKSTPVIWKDLLFVNGYATPMNQPENIVAIPEFDSALTQFDQNRNGQLARTELPNEPAYSWFDFVDLRADGELDFHDWNYFRAALASLNGILAIRLGGQGDMTAQNTVWTYHEFVPQLPSPLIYQDVLYLIDDNGMLTTFRPESGEVIEQGRLKDGGTHFYASPVAADGKVFILSRRGKLTVLEAGGTIKPIAQSDLGELCFATPTISDGKIYLRTVTTLYCFGVK